jgi:hypothetical protein
MVRSRWIKAVMATLVSTGVVWGQSAAPSTPKGPGDPTGRIITVNEPGKLPQKCRVVKWWLDEHGNKVWQVESLDCGETMTIIAESCPVGVDTGHGQSLRTRIFHWKNNCPPTGTPCCPTTCDNCPPCETKVVQTPPPVVVKPTVAPPAPAKVPPAEIMVQTPPPAPKVEIKKQDPLLGDPTEIARKPVDPPKPAPAPSGLIERMPVGGRSVTDSGAVSYMPVPVVTLPPYRQPPPGVLNPQFQVPQAPNPIVNPGRGNAPEACQGGIAYNAFTPTELTPPKPGSPEQSMMANAFSADTDCCPVPPGMPIGGPVGGVFGPPGPPQHPMVMAPTGPRSASPILPPSPYGPVVRLPMPQGAAGQGDMVAKAPAQNSGVAQAAYKAPAATTDGQLTPQQLAGQLHDSLYPSQRELAAEKLACCDGKQTDCAVQALTQAVREDPAAIVRATCVRALAKMKVNSHPVVSVIEAAKHDADPRVRSAAEEAMTGLAPAGARLSAPAPLPVSATVPAANSSPVLPPLPSTK